MIVGKHGGLHGGHIVAMAADQTPVLLAKLRFKV